jgi:hypothetical protein
LLNSLLNEGPWGTAGWLRYRHKRPGKTPNPELRIEFACPIWKANEFDFETSIYGMADEKENIIDDNQGVEKNCHPLSGMASSLCLLDSVMRIFRS